MIFIRMQYFNVFLFLSFHPSVGENEKQPAMCYYCMVRQQDSSANFLGETQDKYTSNEFIVCFVTAADTILDLYPFKYSVYII